MYSNLLHVTIAGVRERGGRPNNLNAAQEKEIAIGRMNMKASNFAACIAMMYLFFILPWMLWSFPDDIGVMAFALTLAAICLCAAGGLFYWNHLLGKQGADILDRAERGEGDEEEKKPMISSYAHTGRYPVESEHVDLVGVEADGTKVGIRAQSAAERYGQKKKAKIDTGLDKKKARPMTAKKKPNLTEYRPLGRPGSARVMPHFSESPSRSP